MLLKTLGLSFGTLAIAGCTGGCTTTERVIERTVYVDGSGNPIDGGEEDFEAFGRVGGGGGGSSTRVVSNESSSRCRGNLSFDVSSKSYPKSSAIEVADYVRANICDHEDPEPPPEVEDCEFTSPSKKSGVCTVSWEGNTVEVSWKPKS